MTLAGLGPLVLDQPRRLVLGGPGQERLGQQVVVDLEARPAVAAGDVAQDPLACQRVQDRPHGGLVDAGVAGQVRLDVRDLAARRGDQVVEGPGGDLLLAAVEGGEGAADVLAGHALRATEPGQRVGAQDPGARLGLLVPDALHDELQVRRLAGDLVHHRLDQLGLDLDALVLGEPLVASGQRAGDRAAGLLAVEVLQPQRVGQDLGHRRTQGVEPCERVAAHREQGADPHVRGVERLGQLGREGRLLAVVQEQLLDLVEQQVELAVEGLAGDPQAVDQRGLRGQPGAARPAGRAGVDGDPGADGRVDGVGQERERVVGAPGVEHHRDAGRRLERAQRVGHAGAQQRALADAALAVQHGQRVGQQVRDQHLALALAAEERARVLVGRLERCEAAVRAAGAQRLAAPGGRPGPPRSRRPERPARRCRAPPRAAARTGRCRPRRPRSGSAAARGRRPGAGRPAGSSAAPGSRGRPGGSCAGAPPGRRAAPRPRRSGPGSRCDRTRSPRSSPTRWCGCGRPARAAAAPPDAP